MKQLFTFFLIMVLFVSCKSEAEKNTDSLTKAIRKRFEDYAFKENQKITLLEINHVTYKIVGESTLDTLRLVTVLEKVKKYEELSDEYNKKARDATDLLRLANSAGSNALQETYRHEAQDYIDKMGIYLDSIKYFNDQDSTLRVRLKSSKNELKEYYDTKFFCKATVGGNNLLDTLTMIFDKEFHYIDTKNL